MTNQTYVLDHQEVKALTDELEGIVQLPLRKAFRQAKDTDEREKFPITARIVRSCVGDDRWEESPNTAAIDTIRKAIRNLPEVMSGRRYGTARTSSGQSSWKGVNERRVAEILFGFRDTDVLDMIGNPYGELLYDPHYRPAALRVAGLNRASASTKGRMIHVIREDIAYALLDMEAEVLARKAVAAEPPEDFSDALKLSPRSADMDQARTEEIIQTEFPDATSVEVVRLALTLNFDPCLTKAACSLAAKLGLSIEVLAQLAAAETARFLDLLARHLGQLRVTSRVQNIIAGIEAENQRSIEALDLLSVTRHEFVPQEFVAAYLMGKRTVGLDAGHRFALVAEDAFYPLMKVGIIECRDRRIFMNPLMQSVIRDIRHSSFQVIFDRLVGQRNHGQAQSGEAAIEIMRQGWSPAMVADHWTAEQVAIFRLHDHLFENARVAKSGKFTDASWFRFVDEMSRRNLREAVGAWHRLEMRSLFEIREATSDSVEFIAQPDDAEFPDADYTGLLRSRFFDKDDFDVALPLFDEMSKRIAALYEWFHSSVEGGLDEEVARRFLVFAIKSVYRPESQTEFETDVGMVKEFDHLPPLSESGKYAIDEGATEMPPEV